MNYPGNNDNDTEQAINNEHTTPYQPVPRGGDYGYYQPGPSSSGEQSYREYARPEAYQAPSSVPDSNESQSGVYHPAPKSVYPATAERDYANYPGHAGYSSTNTNAQSGPDIYRNQQYYNPTGSTYQGPLDAALKPQHQAPRRGFRTLSVLLLAVVLLAVLATGLFAGWEFSRSSLTSTSNGIQQVSVPALKSTDLQARREEVVARIRPAVVQLNITTSQGAVLGSGVIIDKNGYIVTNNHVVAGASSVDQVVLSDGTSIRNAPVVGVDQQDDLAVIKITPPSNLTVAPLGDSSQLKVGQDVLAIGSPLGNTQTVTSGIISALGRNVSEGSNSNGNNGATLPGTIQTDAPINPGNSGGALVDLNGNLIGIPTLTAVDPEFNAPANGVGFAIPSNRVKFIAEQLITTGKVSHTGRAAIGISPVSVDQNLQAQGNLPVNHGVLIYQLVSGGAAEKAGLKAGDVIVQIDGKTINSVSDLEDALLSKNPGDQISVKAYRNSQQMTFNVTLGELKANNN